MFRSVLSVIAGFVAVAVLVMPATIISARLLLGVRGRQQMMTMKPTPGFITVNLVFSLVFAVFGGFLTALIAGRARMQHAGALAALMFVTGILSFLQNVKMKTSEGRVYSGSLVILGPTGALLGGYIQTLCVGS